MSQGCVFCRIISGELQADVVAESAATITFLDSGPVFPGHLLIVPRKHYETMLDLPDEEVGPFFIEVRRAAKAVEVGLGAQGSFVAVNNRVSQTVPHLHTHVIPRTKGDGMKGFFWPRRNYRDETHRADIVTNLRQAFRNL